MFLKQEVDSSSLLKALPRHAIQTRHRGPGDSWRAVSLIPPCTCFMWCFYVLLLGTCAVSLPGPSWLLHILHFQPDYHHVERSFFDHRILRRCPRPYPFLCLWFSFVLQSGLVFCVIPRLIPTTVLVGAQGKGSDGEEVDFTAWSTGRTPQ